MLCFCLDREALCCFGALHGEQPHNPAALCGAQRCLTHACYTDVILMCHLHVCHPGDRAQDSRMKKQCIATRYVILLLLQLLQGTVWAVCLQ